MNRSLSHMFSWLLMLLLLLLLPSTLHALQTTPAAARVAAAAFTSTSQPPAAAAVQLVSPDVTGITEPACLEAARRMQRIQVPVSTDIHPDGQVGISYVHWPAATINNNNNKQQPTLPPVVLVHGFDSSCLEYRRLGPLLASTTSTSTTTTTMMPVSVDTYAVDLLGWGFTQLQGVKTFSADAKVEALQSFIDTVVVIKGNNKQYCIAGASLGGAAAISIAAAASSSSVSSGSCCSGLILIDAQGFVDGIGPMASLPKPFAKLGVGVLKSIPLRSMANQMSYFDTETYATDEAVTVGRLHCVRTPQEEEQLQTEQQQQQQQKMTIDWSDAMVSFMQSGGFTPSKLVSQITIPTMVVWGRQDTILDGTKFGPQFVETIPYFNNNNKNNAAEQEGESESKEGVVWIEDCGHVPHLEQPEQLANAMKIFLTKRVAPTAAAASSSTGLEAGQRRLDSNNTKWTAAAAATTLAALIAAFAADFLPVH